MQLVLTVGLLAVVVYLYTVVAFNFFRKFYNKSEDEDEPDMKCDDMMTVNRCSCSDCLDSTCLLVSHLNWLSLFPQCYLFHMYVGVRAGGGIGDEIEDPAGDPYELYRILFDITFFFFVIVILLAIIQGKSGLCTCTQFFSNIFRFQQWILTWSNVIALANYKKDAGFLHTFNTPHRSTISTVHTPLCLLCSQKFLCGCRFDHWCLRRAERPTGASQRRHGSKRTFHLQLHFLIES